MGYPSNAVATASAVSVRRIRNDWRLAREAHTELQIPAVERANLLVVGTGAVPMLLEMLGLEPDNEGVVSWHAGEPLELPHPSRVATLILHDVDELTEWDQHKLLPWLEQASGMVRTVSTAREPLWPRVKVGAFDETLYYRLNTVYVDVEAIPS